MPVAVDCLAIVCYSMAGHRVINLTDNVYVYGATKYSITGLTEGIRRELREMDSNVKVTVRIEG